MSIPVSLRRLAVIGAAIFSLAWCVGAQASISLSSTRIVFEGKYKEASIAVRNGNSNVLIQSWIESNTPDDTGDLPFAVTPPLARMRSDGQQLLRVLYAGGKNAVPEDKESVFWLNVQEIPEADSGKDTLQVAVRQRIKIFFRPAGLAGSAANAPGALQWRLTDEGGKPVLTVANPSAYYVSINSIVVGAGNSVTVPTMIGPGETRSFPIHRDEPVASARVVFRIVNDYGGVDTFETHLAGSSPVTAKLVEKYVAN